MFSIILPKFTFSLSSQTYLLVYDINSKTFHLFTTTITSELEHQKARKLHTASTNYLSLGNDRQTDNLTFTSGGDPQNDASTTRTKNREEEGVVILFAEELLLEDEMESKLIKAENECLQGGEVK